MLKEIQVTGNKDTRSGFGDGIAEAARKNLNNVALTADLAGSMKLNQFLKEFPERYHARMDTRRWGPGERLVFEPYTQEVYQEARSWIASHGIYPDGNLGGERYQEATFSVMG